MNKQFLVGQVKQVNENERTLDAYASTEALDRDGDRILSTAWEGTLTKFKSNPVLGWAHRYDIPPIGKITDIGTDGRGLRFRAEFANTPFATEIWELYRDGFLNAFSVGFIPGVWVPNDSDGDGEATNGNGKIFTTVELLEVSAVMIPSNPTSLVERGVPVIQFKSIDNFTQLALSQTPPEQTTVEIEGKLPDSLPENATTTADIIDDPPESPEPQIVLTEPPAAVTEPITDVTEAEPANAPTEPDPADDELLAALGEFLDQIRPLLT